MAKKPSTRRATRRPPAAARTRRRVAPRPSRAPELLVATPSASILLDRQAPDDDRARKQFQRAAMEWTYIVRNRRRWSGREALVREQGQHAQRLLREHFRLTHAELLALAKARLAQVAIPYESEEDGWEARVFPWEFVLTAGTRQFRKRDEGLTVIRQLVRAAAHAPSRRRAAKSVLFVESAPGPLATEYSFESERELVRTALDGLRWHEIRNPTHQQLEAEIRSSKPDIIHLAGFDTHQGMALLDARLGSGPSIDPATAHLTRPDPPTRRDGYMLAGDDGGCAAIGAQELARLICGAHTPTLVSCSLWNSASRIAPMMLAEGAGAAIAFQDSFEDEVVESFFAAFYVHFRHARWDVRDAFLAALNKLRAQPSGLVGSGIVLWSDRRLVGDATPRDVNERAEQVQVRVAKEADLTLDPAREQLDDLLIRPEKTIKPFEELNYSLLHNRRPMFEDFKLVKRKTGRMSDMSVVVELNAGGQTFPYRKQFDFKGPEFDLRKDIHAPLTADLVRSVREAVNTSLFVEVLWQNRPVYRNTHLVRLLPADQWRDTEEDRIWLPCFVLPRDPAVGALIEKAHRYVRVLRDDPAAGFDGYQSLDDDREDPAEDVDLQVQAIWSALLHEWQLGYVNPPPSYSKELDSQRLRTPSSILADRSGTCIDLTLLVAACLELVDIYPVIFLLEGHAFPGYWRSPTAQEEFLTGRQGHVDTPVDPRGTLVTGTDSESWVSGKLVYDEIVRQIDAGHLVPIESVKLTENCGFWDAVEAGRENLRPKREFDSMLDILSARFARVTPLPIAESRL